MPLHGYNCKGCKLTDRVRYPCRMRRELVLELIHYPLPRCILLRGRKLPYAHALKPVLTILMACEVKAWYVRHGRFAMLQLDLATLLATERPASEALSTIGQWYACWARPGFPYARIVSMARQPLAGPVGLES